MDKLQELAVLVFITPLYVIVTVAIGALYVMAAVKTFQFISRVLSSKPTRKGADTMKEFFNLLKANGMIMNLVFFMAVAFMLGAAAGIATA